MTPIDPSVPIFVLEPMGSREIFRKYFYQRFKHFRPPLGMEKGGQVTKPIILVKICYKLLYVIQGVENSFGKVTSWPQLISEFLVAHAC